MTALQALGTRLVDLSDAQLKKIPIEDSRLEEAIAEARRIKAWGGLRRQLQYIGKIMRQIDPAPFQQALDELDGQDQRANARFHQIERLRDDLVTQGDRAIDTVLLEFPLADRQHLR
ncbi:MAG: ribosome biogenesis factor YjgA, partial [Halieaceae bacterium]